MKQIGLMGVTLALSMGVGLGTYFYFGSNQAVAALDSHTQTEHVKKIDEAARKDANFVELEPLILPIVDKHGVSQIISLVVALEVENHDHITIVRKLAPKLKDAYIQEMYGTLSKKAALEGGVVQVGVIKNRLNKITIDVLGKNVVGDVLLQVVQQRSI
jgi:flagellar FliL protein